MPNSILKIFYNLTFPFVLVLQPLKTVTMVTKTPHITHDIIETKQSIQ